MKTTRRPGGMILHLPLMLCVVAFSSLPGAPGTVGGDNCQAEGYSNTTTGVGDFFRGYGNAWVQAEMLRDEVRTEAFRAAIIGNRELFKDKIVLDVGAGTGVLSFFAAQAGAAKVFAVERSDMAFVAKQIAVDNNLNGTVTVIHGLMEEVMLPVKSVDIIISEWIGTFLVHESMLDSVIFARDKWLAPGGLLLPDRATLYIAGAEDQAEETTSWDSFHGLNFSALGSAYRQVAAQQCLFRNSLATRHAALLQLDLYTVSVAEQEFSVPFQLDPLDSKVRDVHILASWFVLEFFSPPHGSRRNAAANHSTLSTHPDEPCTHWQQTVFTLAKAVQLQADGVLKGQANVHRASWSARDLKVELTIGAIAERFVIVGAEL